MSQNQILRKILRPVSRLKRDYARRHEYGWNWVLIFALSACVLIWWMAVAAVICHADTYDADVIVDAIYRAEGAEKAKKPFGILSVPCKGYEDCRRVCENTVINSFTRWQVAGASGDFLEFLASRYAPVGAANDPSGLNRNWLKNVRYFIAKAGDE